MWHFRAVGVDGFHDQVIFFFSVPLSDSVLIASHFANCELAPFYSVSHPWLNELTSKTFNLLEKFRLLNQNWRNCSYFLGWKLADLLISRRPQLVSLAGTGLTAIMAPLKLTANATFIYVSLFRQ